MNNFSTENKALNKDEEDINLREIVMKYLRFWKWFILSVFVFMLIGVLIFLRADRVYEVSTSVYLKEDKGTGSQKGSALGSLEELGLLSTTNNIDNEIAVFSSPNLMKQVVMDLDLHTRYFVDGFFRNTEVYLQCPYYVRLENTKPDELSGVINLSFTPVDNGLNIDGFYEVHREKTSISTSLDKIPGYIDLPDDLGKLYIDYRKDKEEDEEKNKEKLEKGYHIYINNAQREANELVSLLKINSTTKNSSVLKIDINTMNITKGMDILNRIVAIYNQNNVKDNNEIAVNSSKFIKERLDTIEIELREVENEIVRYKNDQRITNVSADATFYMEQTGLIEQKKIDIETQLKTVELVEAFINDPKNKNQLIPNLGISDPALAEVIASYNSLLLSYDRLVNSTSEDNPRRVRSLSDLENTRKSIQTSVANVKRAMNIAKRELDTKSSSILSRMNMVPSQERGLLEINRQQQVKQAIYVYLKQMLEETNITMASTSDKAKVITDPMAPTHAISPKRNIIFLVFLLLGIIVPAIIIYIKDKLQINITNREDLESLSNVSVIGEIMKKEEDDNIVVKASKTTPIVELFRTLRNNVKFILDSPDKKVILVTSTVPGEGKTFVSINLAASFTLSDKKVLLIGMDIRNPKLAADMGFTKGAGLTSYLSGSEPDWRSLISHLNEFPNLDILQAGAIPPNPNELLMKPALSKLLEDAKKYYDIIIIDSAPIGVVSDTFLLASQADMTVYVTRENVTPKNAISYVNEVHDDNKLPNMYLVLNGVELARNKGRYGRYGYGYTYGYGMKK